MVQTRGILSGTKLTKTAALLLLLLLLVGCGKHACTMVAGESRERHTCYYPPPLLLVATAAVAHLWGSANFTMRGLGLDMSETAPLFCSTAVSACPHL